MSRSSSTALPSALVPDLATLLAAGILRLQVRPGHSADSTAAGLEVPAPAPLSVTSPRVNGAETPFQKGSDA
jgi:hypothetical protein